jgi:hypothetical protein
MMTADNKPRRQQDEVVGGNRVVAVLCWLAVSSRDHTMRYAP